MGCESCKKTDGKLADGKGQSVPFVVHESAQARNERTVKRLVIAIIVLALLWFATIGIGIYAWMQYYYTGEETVTEYTQDGEGLNIIGNRNTAGIYNGTNFDD